MNFFYPLFNKKINAFLLSVFLLSCLSANVTAQIKSTDWQMNAATARTQSTISAIPNTAMRTTISIEKFKQKLRSEKQEIQIPNPEGRFETFVIEPTNVVAREVAHLYTIKTFRGYKKNDPSVGIAADISDGGFHAAVLTANTTYFIEPINTKTASQYAVFYKRSSSSSKINCLVKTAADKKLQTHQANKRSAPSTKRTYKLAIVATGEFGQQFGGSPYSATNVLNALAAGVNMLDVVFLRDLGVNFTLVSTAAMVFENPATDPYDVDNEEDIAAENETIIGNAVGGNGYDLGHAVIWEEIGGAAVPGVCDETEKYNAYSGGVGTTTEFWISLVAHEVGHQFGARHNFASAECETSADNFRYEPGEGSSIMGYASICDISAQYAEISDPYFHYVSIASMVNFLETATCATTSANGNANDPIPTAHDDITIPKQTPFLLVGSATDANDGASSLTYSWEQFDGGASATTGPPDCNSTNAPLFRYRPPMSTSIRSFPQYTDVLAGNNDQQWEKLPCTAREINFSLAVRDNNPNFGRTANDLMKITVANTGPFNVTAPNGGETLTGNSASTITWTVNGTNAHCANVDILLSTDGGATFTVIADATTNDGTESVMIPNTASTTARIIVRCDVTGGFRSASTFYDISNANFTITAETPSGCETDLAVSNFANPTVSGDYSASNTITSDKKLADASAVNFYAGTSITLKPGFEVPSGTQFLAKIQDCSTVETTCDCQLDTMGLFNYLSTLTLKEQEPLEISIENATSTFAVLHGTIGASTPNKVQNLINNFPNVTTLVFTTIPGSEDDDANLIAARAVNEKGYTTYLPAVNAFANTLNFEAFIASGGTDLFLAGKTRVADEGAEVGVHAWANGEGNQATDFPRGNAVHQPYIDYYVSLGFSTMAAEDFYYFTINAAPAASIHKMTAAELQQYNIRTCFRPANCNNNGNQDLELRFDNLDYGDYSQNDAILAAPEPFLLSTSTAASFAANNIQLYPNPTTNQFTIGFPDFSGQSYQIQLTNLNGQLVSQQIVTSENVAIDVTNLANGLYVVKLITADKIFSDKLVIQRK